MKKCKRCDHEWLPRSEKLPVQCPRCKSYKWDAEKTVNNAPSEAVEGQTTTKGYIAPRSLENTATYEDTEAGLRDSG